MEADENEPIPGPLDQEQRLVADARDGDLQARSVLIRRFQPLVRRYLEKRMGPRLLRFLSPEDLLQDVLLRGVKGLEKLREGARPEEFRGLLLRHAQWVLLDHGRKSGGFMGESTALGARALEGMEQVKPVPERPGKAKDFDGEVTADDRSLWLHDLVARLDEKYACVVRLYLAGKTHVEIANELGISAETARKRFLRAAMKLNSGTQEPGS